MPRTFSVLVADSFVARSNAYRLSSTQKEPCKLSVVRDYHTFVKALSEEKWDVVLMSGNLWGTPGLSTTETLSEVLTAAFYKGAMDLVVVNSPIEDSGKEMIELLKLGGVTSAWVPYNYLTPSKHEIRTVSYSFH